MFAVEKKDDIAILRMQYGSANAMDLNFCVDLSNMIRELAEHSSRAIVLTGQGKIFSAGVDLPQLLAGGVDYVRQFLPALDELLTTLFFCNKPVVAAVNGHAIAGGCLLTCCADRRFMAAGKSRIGVPELRVGVPFPVVALEIMRARTNPDFIAEVILDAATYAPAEARQRGLIDVVVEPEQLMGEALAAAESLAAIRPGLFGFSKRQLRQPVREVINARSRAQATELYALWESAETHAAINEFVARTLKKPQDS
ncbi:enoyl-CoA hydratase/isomerase family protein [Geopsychrobacter electrodiphilus]|uniref:enoyl-CoA hydratase/isomerase family protein n=1 Tax=Geopsychrobacter electrodiphilus TaxID=225196 RepID=UPI000377A8E4|nr:enoyl-CoA hydratase/isomerase family protein [Geopsychrobacter electrodiphilus]